jgi:hypothetical protein
MKKLFSEQSFTLTLQNFKSRNYFSTLPAKISLGTVGLGSILLFIGGVIRLIKPKLFYVKAIEDIPKYISHYVKQVSVCIDGKIVSEEHKTTQNGVKYVLIETSE